MISVPNGAGVRFMVNGAELTLTGDATIKAVKGGKMEVSLFEGSGRIVTNGQEQYFGAGQKVNVQLGGENGNESVSKPSIPETLTQTELDTVCALTGQLCSQDQITPVTSDNAQQTIGEKLGITPTQIPTLRLIPTRTQLPVFATNTVIVLPTRTSTQLRTHTPFRTPTRTRTITYVSPAKTSTPTNRPVNTVTPVVPTFTSIKTPSSTATPTQVPSVTVTRTPTSTGTVTQTSTLISTSTETQTSTPISTSTETLTPTPTNTPVLACGSMANPIITISGAPAKQLLTTITNNTGSAIALTSISINNTATLNSITANAVTIWNGPDDGSQPMSISSWLGVSGDRQIAASGGTMNLVFVFQNPVTSVATNFEFNFDSGCTLTANYP